RLCAGPPGDQISRDLARRRSLAGADRRHPRDCSIPLLDADAARHRIVARNRICLGCPAVTAAASDRQNAVTLWPVCGSAPPSPFSTELGLLTPARILFASWSVFCTAETSRHGGEFHPIWYATSLTAPYIAVNEDERWRSRRFGRDSFQTRSTR